MNKILIDSDVLLDFFFDRKPFGEISARILSLCEKKQVDGFVTPVIISNVYYLLRKAATHEKAIESLLMLISFIDIIPINKKAVLTALHSDFKDFEDALQNFSAQDAKEVNIIVTRNVKDYQYSKLTVLTPADYLIKLSKT